jgi:hypothetical protein
MAKPHLEFVTVDMGSGWESPPGYPPGIRQKVLASDLDEAKKTGSRSRLLRFEPEAFSTQPFVHDYFEEVFLISGDLIVDGTPCAPFTYACRPPHTPHGPFRSNTGCLLFELHYYG